VTRPAPAPTPAPRRGGRRGAARGHPGRASLRRTWAAIGLLGLCAAAASGAAAGAPAGPERPAGAGDDPLVTWLPRLARVSSLYRDATLRFSCREIISWLDANGISRRRRFDYLYVFEEGAGFQNYRTDPAVAGAHAAAVDPAGYGIPRFLENVYLWMFLFAETRWPYHQYRFGGETEVLGRPAVEIGFEPIPPYRYEVNGWGGTAWFDRDTAQILRVEAHRPEEYRRMRDLQDGRGPGEAVVERVETEFTVEKNGMRFPGRARIEQARYRAKAGGKRSSTAILRVEQAYRNYRFFQVRTADQVRRIVFAADGG
jgi:hypothetical protein